MSKRRTGAKENIKQFLLAHVGEVVTSHDLQSAAGPNVTEWARRVRELRTEEGWPIRTRNDDASLRPGEYRLDSLPDESGEFVFARTISARLRAQILRRNGYTCQMCGAGAGDPDDLNPNRGVRLHVGHIVDKIHGGEDIPSNLRALCSSCNEGAKDLTQGPPSWASLLSHIRPASEADQRRVLDWLKRKFGE